MRLQSYLQEEYHSRVKVYNDTYEVFVNPSKKEMNEFKMIRFIGDIPKKKLYIWDAFGALHDAIWSNMYKKDLGSDIMTGKIIAGLLEKLGGKWELTEYDGNEHMIAYLDKLPVRQIKDYVKKTKWLDKYFNFTEPFKDSMKEMGKWPGKE